MRSQKTYAWGTKEGELPINSSNTPYALLSFEVIPFKSTSRIALLRVSTLGSHMNLQLYSR